MTAVPRWVRLSPAALSVWAKTPDGYRRDPSGWDGSWMRLAQHMSDSAAVAATLWDEWLAPHARSWSAAQLGLSAEEARTLLCFLTGAHDIGKCTPGFASQVPSLFLDMQDAGLVPPALYGSAPHAHVGQVILERWLSERLAGWGPSTGRLGAQLPRALASLAGAHHGMPPTSAQKQHIVNGAGHYVGGAPWRQVQDELLSALGDELELDPVLRKVASAGPTPVRRLGPLLSLWTGVCIIADWMASDQSRFGLGDPRNSVDRAAQAWGDLGLGSTWRSSWQGGVDQLMQHVGLPDGAHLRPVQHAAIARAEAMTAPGLMIIEAPMGVGKTEAALAAAEVMASRFGLGGIFFGLPTMATSNAMFGRVLRWVQQVGGGKVTLAHGLATLNDDYAGLISQASISSIYDEAPPKQPSGVAPHAAGAIVHSWLTGSKKGPLADFCVGTIDQLLVSALQTKHVMLRQLAMATKVVIVDEVHAADDFMRRYLCRALTWLAALGVPVILLTATLPPAQRDELLSGYREGLPIDSEPESVAGDVYPRITVVEPTGVSLTPVDGSGVVTEVDVSAIPDDAATLTGRLIDVLEGGGCVGIVCNTVSRAQDLARELIPHFGEDVILLHSRYIGPDRSRLEGRLQEMLGPRGERPQRLIVVATQVIEQSLDIDFDLLVSDLAPIDLVLQRMGRLHRHPRQRPARMRSAHCWVRGVEDWGADIPIPVRGTRLVYREDRPLRAAAVLGLHGPEGRSRVTVPADIPRLVREGYESRLAACIPSGWHHKLTQTRADEDQHAAQQRSKAAQHLLAEPYEAAGLTGLIHRESRADDRVAPSVRDTEDSLEVLAARLVDEVVTLMDGSGAEVTTDMVPSAALAKRLAASRLRLPRWLATAELIAMLEAQGVVAWQESGWLVGELVLFFDAEGTALVGGHRLYYDSFWGLRERLDSDGPHGG